MDNRLAESIIIDGVELSIGYWAKIRAYEHTQRVQATIDEYGDDNKVLSSHILNVDTVNKAFETLKAGKVEGLNEKYRARLLGQMYLSGEDADLDSDDADNIIQIGLFGKIVYG